MGVLREHTAQEEADVGPGTKKAKETWRKASMGRESSGVGDARKGFCAVSVFSDESLVQIKMGIKAFTAEWLKSRAWGFRNNRTQFLGPLLPNYTSEHVTQALKNLIFRI